jgi:hypothetical protein
LPTFNQTLLKFFSLFGSPDTLTSSFGFFSFSDFQAYKVGPDEDLCIVDEAFTALSRSDNAVFSTFAAKDYANS